MTLIDTDNILDENSDIKEESAKESTAKKKQSPIDPAYAKELVKRARSEGIDIAGPGGILAELTKNVLEAALEAELSNHLGYETYEYAGRNTGNSRNGKTKKSLKTDIGTLDLEIPRDREGTFEPVIVPKHTRKMKGLSDAIISLYAKGLTTGEIQAHLEEIYEVKVSKETISKITDAVIQELSIWQNRPLDSVYPVVFIDAIFIKIRDGSVSNRPVYVALGGNLEGERDVLGLWIGQGGEGAKYWLSVLTELKNRGINDVCILCCDGLKGLPETINTVWEKTIVQTCVVHLVRSTLRYVSKTDWQKITPELRAIYTCPGVDAAEQRFLEFEEKWKEKYPAVISLWRNSWEQFTTFLAFPQEVRSVIYTTNAIESLNAKFRRATKIRGHFPNEQAALKVLFLAICENRKGGVEPSAVGRVRNWNQALNSFAIYFGERITGQ